MPNTESLNPRFSDIDSWPTIEAVEAMLEGQMSAIASIKSQTQRISAAAEAAAARLQNGGRLVYVGAGTSGRVAVQDGVELGPTFGWPSERLLYLMAGGIDALVHSAEGAEDDADDARSRVRESAISADDVVIGVAASGRTPFTIAALNAANDAGALTIAIVNNAGTDLLRAAQHGLLAATGSEAIAGSTEHREVYKKQTGGRGKFADILVKISHQDNPEKKGLEFINSIKGGNIPREFIPSVEKGFRESMKNGVLAGFPLESMKVELIDGSFHAVDSDSLSFELCAKMAYRAALKACSPILLEPIMKMEVVTPEDYFGDVQGDLNRRRGMPTGMDDRAGAKVLKADVPLSEMFGYVTQLRTITSGRATSSMEFSHYAAAPKNVAEDVISKAK